MNRATKGCSLAYINKCASVLQGCDTTSQLHYTTLAPLFPSFLPYIISSSLFFLLSFINLFTHLLPYFPVIFSALMSSLSFFFAAFPYLFLFTSFILHTFSSPLSIPPIFLPVSTFFLNNCFPSLYWLYQCRVLVCFGWEWRAHFSTTPPITSSTNSRWSPGGVKCVGSTSAQCVTPVS